MKESGREDTIATFYLVGVLMMIGGFIMILYIFPYRPPSGTPDWVMYGPYVFVLGLLMIILGWILRQTWK